MKNKFLSRIGQWHTPPYLRKCLTSLKALTLLLVMLMSANVWGGETTFTPSSGTSTSGVTISPITFVFTDGSTATKWYDDGLRFYEGATITVSSESTITKIEFTHGVGNNGCLVLDGSTGTYSSKVWTGSAKSIKFKVTHNSGTKNGQVKLTKVVVTYEGASKTLESIAISGTPNKTTYETGESFDVTGLTVTGTYDDASPADLTDDAEWTIDPATFTSTSQTSVSVTATVDGKSDSKQYNVTVTEHDVVPGTYEIALNKDLYGIATAGSVAEEQSAKVHDITVVSGCASDASSKTYYDAAHIRYYAKSYLKLSVPDGYEITSVVFAEPSSGKRWDGKITSTQASYNADTKTWTGKSQNVDFAFEAQNRPASIKVTFAAKKVVSGITVKNNPSKTTYYVGDDFDPAGLVITASFASGDPEDIAYTEDNKDAFSFSGFNSEAEATDQEITVTYAEKSATFTVDIEEARTLTGIEVATAPTKTVYEVGEALDLTGLVVNGIFSKGDPEPVGYTADPEDGSTLDATGTTTVTLTSVDNTELTTSFNVTVNAIVGDRLTLASTGVSGSSYAEWSGKTGSEGVAVYAGKSAGSNNSIQLNASNPQGIVSTTSGGLIRKVKVDWNSSTSSTGNRSIDIYGSNTAYTGSGDIYDTEKQGTKLGSIVCGTSTELEISGDYEYVGVRAIGGALYMNSITFVWSAPKELTSIAVKTAPTVVNYAAGEFFNPAGLVITATYDDASTKDITYDANDTKWEFAPGLTDKLDATDDEVIISYNDIMCDDALEITVNRIASNLAAVSATKILVVEDAPSLADWYTVDANYDGTVSFQSDNEEVFYVEGAEGLALAAGSATLTITAPQTDTYAQASVTVAVTVNAAAVPCSVKWMNNGEEYTVGNPSTTVNAGQKVTKLPTAPEPCDDQHVFKGWTNNPIATPQAAAPDILFTDAASAPTVDADNTVYYAVYAVESQDEDIDSYTFTGVGTITGGVATLTTSSGNTIKMDKGEGSNNPAWNAGASEARLYAKGLMTVSSSENITKIVYSYTVNANNKGVSPTIDGVAGKTNVGTWDSESKTWTGSDTEVTFSTSGSAGNIGFTNVTIYTGGGYVYSDYSTTCAAIELDKIELSGTYPTTFLVGDAFSHEGMTVTASYTNSTTTKNVTNLATFTDKTTGEAVDMSAAGSKTILVSYTEDENTKTTEYDITINDWPNKTIAEFIAAKGVKCYLTAFVSNLDGNNYDLTDNSGTIHGYKYTLADGVSALANGDRIRVRAEEYTTFQDAPEVMNIVVIEKLAYSAIAVSGTMSVTEYTEGNTLNSDGLVVKGKYSDEDEATHVITDGITWNMPTAVLGTSEYDVTATVGTLPSPVYHVTGITVNAAKVLTGIAITTEPKKTFWVGENFSTAGIQVTASYDGADDADVTALCSFSRAEAQITDAIVNETITVSYTEGTETKTATYTINANWMTLADLVENVTPTETAVKVWVKITDALVKARNNSYLTTDVTYGDSQTKEVKIYKSGVDATWVAGGTISGELKDVDWKHYTSGGNDDWELMPNDWSWATYTPAAPTPVTGVSLSESTLKIKVGKTATLTATVTPDNATDKSVTWSIINDYANGKITVSDAGVVSVAADATEGATADVQVTTTDGGFTATCNVTVVVPVMTNYYLVTDASTLHVGDIIVMAATKDDKTYVNGSLSGDYLTSAEATLTGDVLSTADAFEFVLGGEEGAWTLTSTDGTLGATNVKKLTYDNTKDKFVGTWTIAITDNVATIASTKQDGGTDNNGYGHFLYNASSPRFLTYTSDASATMLLPQLYRKYETIRTGMIDGQIGTGCQTKNILDVKGATLYQVNYTYGSYLEFMEVTYPVEAGMPIIMQADGTNGGKVEVLYGENEVTEAIYNNDGLYGYIGVGQFDIPEGYPYYVFKGGMLRPSQGNYTTSGHAYIKLDAVPTEDQLAGSSAPRRRMSVGVERSMPTGFETIMMQKGMNKVIMNNQLFLIRDGKLFNAQGALVK